MSNIYENIVRTMNRISAKAMLIRRTEPSNSSNFNVDRDYFLCIMLNNLFYTVLHVDTNFDRAIPARPKICFHMKLHILFILNSRLLL